MDEKYCSECGAVINRKAEICPKCGVRVAYLPTSVRTITEEPVNMTSIELAGIGERIIAELIDEVVAIIGFIMIFIPGIIYMIIQDGINNGRSVGKKAMGLRVVDYQTGAPCDYTKSFLRALGNIIDMWFTLYLIVFLTSEHRGIGDRIAGTIVIKDI